jgi:hypothetical protein
MKTTKLLMYCSAGFLFMCVLGLMAVQWSAGNQITAFVIGAIAGGAFFGYFKSAYSEEQTEARNKAMAGVPRQTNTLQIRRDADGVDKTIDRPFDRRAD